MTGVVTGSGVHSRIQYLSPNQTSSRPPKRGCSLLVGSLTEPYLDCWHRLTLVHGPTYNMMQPRLSMPEIDGPLARTVICVRGWMSKALCWSNLNVSDYSRKNAATLCWLVRVEPIHIFSASTWMLHASPQITESCWWFLVLMEWPSTAAVGG